MIFLWHYFMICSTFVLSWWLRKWDIYLIFIKKVWVIFWRSCSGIRSAADFEVLLNIRSQFWSCEEKNKRVEYVCVSPISVTCIQLQNVPLNLFLSQFTKNLRLRNKNTVTETHTLKFNVWAKGDNAYWKDQNFIFHQVLSWQKLWLSTEERICSMATGYYVSSIVQFSLLNCPHCGCVSESKGMQWRIHKSLSYKNTVSENMHIFRVL